MISEAAETLFLSQPTVSLQIQALEREMNLKVFERRGPRIKLTPEGQVLALFDMAHKQCSDKGWRGCTFLRASGEFGDVESPVHAAAANHGARMLAFITDLCAAIGVKNPGQLAQQLLVVHTGAVASAKTAAPSSAGPPLKPLPG